MNNTKFNKYYDVLLRGAAACVAGAGALLAVPAHGAATTDVIPKWIIAADAPLPASSGQATTSPATGGTASSTADVRQPVNSATASASLSGSSVKAHVPLPASGGATATVLAQGESPAMGLSSGMATTAADDAAAVFQIRECRGDSVGECDTKLANGGRGGSSGAASSGGSGSNSASGN